MIDITIVIPCYNAEGKLHHIFESVTEALKYPYVEAIFVDDESTDGTLEILKDFSVDTRGNVEVYSIEKGGPGGARNYGLKKAKGKYVWFVDADDSIVPDTLEIVHTRIEEAFDFFEFAIVYDGIRTEKMEKKSGIFDLTNLDERIELMQNTGRLPNKIFKKELLLKHQLFYPENCFFEDNYLLFLLPIYVDTYYRSEKVAYNCRTNEDSITRTSLNSAFFDRMETASVGFQLAMQHSAPELKRALEDKFLTLYLKGTVMRLLSRWPSKEWWYAAKTIKYFRCKSPLPKKRYMEDLWTGSAFTKLRVATVNLLSFCIPLDENFVCTMHNAFWKKKIVFRKRPSERVVIENCSVIAPFDQE